MIPVAKFVSTTVYVYLPGCIIVLFYLYFINIPGIFKDSKEIYNEKLFKYYGRSLKVAPIEIALFSLNLIFLIILMSSKRDL